MKIVPSILDCDFGYLSEEIKRIENTGIDMLHIDVMDGCFVPNISFGFPILNAVKRATNLPFDIHLMIDKPEIHIEKFLAYEPKYLTFHLEATENIQEIINTIKSTSTKVGLAINPSTSLDEIEPYFAQIDLVLFMTVEPGFGGQSFDKNVLNKINAAKYLKEQKKLCNLLFQVDGGINDQSIKYFNDNTIDLAVAGTFIFKGNDYKEQIRKLQISP